MADEILKRDQNRITVLAGVTDNAALDITMLRVDPTTKRLLISASGAGLGTVTSVSVVTANGISGSVATATTTPAITLTLGAITPTSVNGLTLVAQAVGFTIAGGTTSKTLTVSLDASVSGTNTGDNATNTQYSGLAASKADVGQQFYIGTTQVAINRVSAALTLAGITLTTPDIGTPSAGVLTNCTGLPEAGLLDNAVTLAKMAGGTDGNLITYDAAGDPAYIATGDSGQVLTSNGAGTAPTFQTPSGGTPRFTLTYDMSAVARFISSLTGTGALTLTTTVPGGLMNATGATDGSKASFYSSSSPAEAIYADSPELQAYAVMSSDTSTAFVSWVLIDGNNTPPDSSGVMTGRHIGYILDTTVLYASNADDVAQTRTDVSSGITMTQDNIFRAVQSGSANIKFYINKTLVATHTTNIKSTGSTNTLIYCGINNDTGTTTNRNQIVSNFNILFDAQ